MKSMSFKIYGALFKQTIEQVKDRLKENFRPDANYADYSGTVEVLASEVTQVVDWLFDATPDDEGKIRIPISAWVKESKKTKQKYLSLQISPPKPPKPAAPPEDDDLLPF